MTENSTQNAQTSQFNATNSANPLISTFDSRGVATLTLNRPERCNAFSLDLARSLLVELRRLANDNSTKIVLLQGAGLHFCGGLDLREATVGADVPLLESLEKTGLNPDDFVEKASNLFAKTTFDAKIPRFRLTPRLVQEILLQLRLLPQIVVARVRGAACGGGAGVVSVCDFVVADSTFRAAFTETKRGLFPTLLFPFLRRKLPISALQEVVLTASPFDAARARELGFVQQIVAPESLDAAVEKTISLFLSNERAALREAKRLFNRELLPSNAEIQEGWREHCRAWESDAGREGIAAFLDKRPPNWTAFANVD